MSMPRKNDKKPIHKSDRREERSSDEVAAGKQGETKPGGPHDAGSSPAHQPEGYGSPAYGEFARPEGFEESHSGEHKEAAAGGVHGQEGYGWEKPGGIRPEGLESEQPGEAADEEDTERVSQPTKSEQGGGDQKKPQKNDR